ncbi:MAG TPA: ROK family protein, partial [Chryseosolibacter sp.]
ETIALGGRKGKEVGDLVAGQVMKHLSERSRVTAIGISVPGISHSATGTVWAPNIPGWENYPLIEEVANIAGGVPVAMDSDRACCMFGELWRGNALGCSDAIYLAVGTGIGAGILTEGRILRGSHDVAGAVGWMALDTPFQKKYVACGCFEYYASGDGIAKFTREVLAESGDYNGALKRHPPEKITAHLVFEAFEKNDAVAVRVFGGVIEYWGMAVANLISIFNPEKVIFGGGVFGPAVKFIGPIRDEAKKWAQPVSFSQVSFEASALGGNAALYGAGFIALNKMSQT